MKKLTNLRFLVVSLVLVCNSLLFAQKNYELVSPVREMKNKLRSDELKSKFGKIKPSQTLSTTNQSDYDVKSYEIAIEVFPTTETIKGSVKTTFAIVNATTTITYDFANSLTVDSVKVGNLTTAFTHLNDLLDIPIGANDTTTTVFYHGAPSASGFQGFDFSTHGPNNMPLITTLSEPFGARSWWPCKDHPIDKALVKMAITCPDNLTGVSNGLLVSQTNNGNGTKTFFYEHGYLITTYLVELNVSDYSHFTYYYHYTATDSMPLEFYAYPEKLAQAMEDFNATDDVLTAISQRFGEYRFLNEHYGMVMFPWGGAMEHQTLTSYGNNLVLGNHYYDWINAHEAGHQWFGDYVSPKSWDHIWLNEGFATYIEAIWAEYNGGKTAYLNDIMAEMFNSFYNVTVIADSLDPFGNTNAIYNKGGIVLHMLRGVMGDTNFFAALNNYLNQYAYGNAETENLMDFCSAEYGTSLAWFFNQWIYETGVLSYQHAWDWNPATQTLKIALKQNGNKFYKMPVQFKFSGSGIDTVLTFMNDNYLLNTFQIFTTTLPFTPTTMVVDPENWILANKQPTSFPAGIEEPNKNPVTKTFELHSNFPNPFNPTTTIPFELKNNSKVTLKIYNQLGQEIATVFEGTLAPNFYNFVWDGVNQNGEPVSSGTYFYKLNVGGEVQTKSMTLLK